MKAKLIALLLLLFLSIIATGCSLPAPAPSSESAASPGEVLVGGDRDEHGCIGSAGYSWCEPKQKCLREWEEPCISGGEASPEKASEPEDLPATDYPYGLFVEYTGADIGSVRGSARIPFTVDSHNKITSPGGHFDITGTVGAFNAHGTVNIKMSGELQYNKSDGQWILDLMLKPSINDYIWEGGGMVMDNSMEEWDAPFIMPFEEGAVIEQPGLVFKMTLQDIPLWPIPLAD